MQPYRRGAETPLRVRRMRLREQPRRVRVARTTFGKRRRHQAAMEAALRAVCEGGGDERNGGTR